MTKHRKKQKGAKNVRHTGDKSIAARETNKTKIPILLLIAILAGIPFALGKYIEFNTPGAFDSGSYVYSAAHIVSGAEIGVDEKPSARMGTLLVNMAGVRLFGFNEHSPGSRQCHRRLHLSVLTAVRKVRKHKRTVYDSVYAPGRQPAHTL